MYGPMTFYGNTNSGDAESTATFIENMSVGTLSEDDQLQLSAF